MKRWKLEWAEARKGDSGGYVVTDGAERLQFASKSEAVGEAQRRNGFEPADGDEQTYAAQLAEWYRRRSS